MVVLLLAVYVPATAVSAPLGDDSLLAECHVVLTSSIQPLPAYSPKDVWINYTVNGSRGEDDHVVRWTELWYQRGGSGTWAVYAPPWNPTGHWTGTSWNDRWDDEDEGGHHVVSGTIIFDTSFTGGDAYYNFTTLVVGPDHKREAGPPDAPAVVKANTTVDSQPPILFIAKPTPGSWTNSEWLQWQAIDSVSGVASVSVSVDAGAVQDFTHASGTMNMSLATQGVHAVVVTAEDRAGNAVTVPISFHYDTVAPTLQITAPSADAYLDSTHVDVTWAMSDAAGISDLRLSVDSLPQVSLSNTTRSYALQGLGETGHLVSILAVDPAGNMAMETVAFDVDVTPPALQIALPVSGTYSTSRQLQVVWMASDSGSGIDHYQVSLDGGAAATIANAAGDAFPNVAEGPHTVTVRAYDRAGNVATATSTVTVDYTPPALAVGAPQSGATVYGVVSVNWTASDAGSGLASVDVLVEGSDTPAGIGQTTFAVPTALSVGPHAVTVRAWDKAGNMNEVTVAFLYGGSAPRNPTPSGVPAFDFWWVLAAVLAIAVAAAYVAVRRRRKLKS